MPRNASGIYTLPEPPVIPGTTILSADENSTRDDIAAEITSSLDRSGRGGMLAPLRLVDGIITSPGLAFNLDTNTGIMRSGADQMDMVAGAVAVLRFLTVASGVNGFSMTPAIAAGSPILSVFGADANINLLFQPKGAASVILRDNNANEVAIFGPAVAAAVNEFTFKNAATGTPIRLEASGGDADISINVVPKGTGTFQVNGSRILGDYLAIAKGDILVATGAGAFVRKAVGPDMNVLMGSAGAADGLAYTPPPFGLFQNITPASFTFNTGAMTIAWKTQDNGDPTDADMGIATFRNASLTSGLYQYRKIVAAMSLVISSGSTLGHANAVDCPIYHYLLDNAGTVVPAVSTKFFGYYGIASTTAEGGAGGADSATVMYAAAAHVNLPFICVARTKHNEAAAGTWATPILEFQYAPFPYKAPTMQFFDTTGANTYTRPWDLLSVRVTVQAGGGGGGGADANAGGNAGVGGGGGAGGHSVKRILSDALGFTETATVGVGGSGGNTAGTSGGAGGSSSFGAHLSATGGSGGAGSGTSAANVDVSAGGAGGIGSSGDVNCGGGDGINGICVGATSGAGESVGIGGGGGNSVWGSGGRGGAIQTSTGSAGVSGNNYGGGGGGGVTTATAGIGGAAGAKGCVLVEEFYS